MLEQSWRASCFKIVGKTRRLQYFCGCSRGLAIPCSVMGRSATGRPFPCCGVSNNDKDRAYVAEMIQCCRDWGRNVQRCSCREKKMTRHCGEKLHVGEDHPESPTLARYLEVQLVLIDECLSSKPHPPLWVRHALAGGRIVRPPAEDLVGHQSGAG